MTARRPVWLFSLDTEQFTFIPLVTGGLKAWFQEYGATASDTDLEIIHFRYHLDAARWLAADWTSTERDKAWQAARYGRPPVAAFSCYTWNTPTFMTMIARMKADCPDLLVVVGGPHVQACDDYLRRQPVDIVVLGEGERAFTDILDAPEPFDRDAMLFIPGIALSDETGRVHKTRQRPLLKELDLLPSVTAVVPFADPAGRPYRWAAYETARGCPYACSYCQWDTGAIGVKVGQHSLGRVQADLTALMEGGVEGLLFCDANFGSLPDDIQKAQTIVELNERLGRPVHFATCWAKSHTEQVLSSARLLHRHRLLEHYTIALQTLTPGALKTSHRVNMSDWSSAARQLVNDGIPIVSELIWGLPGETLADFEANLDTLTKTFPSHTIYPYAMLPATSLYDRRQELGIETVELAPYGTARADYIVACNSFDREQGQRGYTLITAFILLYRGNVIPLTARYIALQELGSLSRLLTVAIERLIEQFLPGMPALAGAEPTEIFEHREFVYRWILQHSDEAFETIVEVLSAGLEHAGCGASVPTVRRLLQLDRLLIPSIDRGFRSSEAQLDFDAGIVLACLDEMRLPPNEALAESTRHHVKIHHGWDFGEDLVPRPQPVTSGSLLARYPVWP
jgi:tRNA A37 methylthiotransferase MiaB